MTDITTITTNEELVQDTVQAPVTEEPVKKKRGRKPNPDKKKMYFSDKEEQAVIDYCASTNDAERNYIFSRILYPAFTRMVESIIRRYTLFKPGEEFEDTFSDAMGFIAMKMNHYDPSKNTKAYSYFGTICKNYLIHERQKAQDRISSTLSYDTVYNEVNPDTRQVSMDDPFNEPTFAQKMLHETANEIEKMINNSIENNLNENDIKVGNALVHIMRNWDILFDTAFTSNESKKLNKSTVDSYIKDTTELKTNVIRESKKKYAAAYERFKEILLNKNP